MPKIIVPARSYRLQWLVVALLAVFATTCGAGCSNQVADGDHHSSSSSNVNATPTRIISLAPNVTEIVFALGLGDSLVGVTDACDYPPQATKIEPVASSSGPNMEKVLSLSPQLIIVVAKMQRPEVVSTLKNAGIRVLELQIANIADLLAAIEQVGAATGRTEQARSLVEKMRANLQSVAVSMAKQSSKFKVFVVVDEKPLVTAGRQSFLNDVIARAGGVNAANELDRDYPQVNPETVLAWNPDFLLLDYTAGGDKAKALGDQFGWNNMTAIKERRVIGDINPDLLMRPGPRIVDGIKALAARLQK